MSVAGVVLKPRTSATEAQYVQLIKFLRALSEPQDANDPNGPKKTVDQAFAEHPVPSEVDRLREVEAQKKQDAQKAAAEAAAEQRRKQQEKEAAEEEKRREAEAARKAAEEEEQKRREVEERRKGQALQSRIDELLNPDTSTLAPVFKRVLETSSFATPEALENFLTTVSRTPPLNNVFVGDSNSPIWKTYLQGYGEIPQLDATYIADESAVGKQRLQARVFALSYQGNDSDEILRKALAFSQ